MNNLPIGWTKTTLGEISRNVMYGLNAKAIAFDGKRKYIRITDIDDESNKFHPAPLTSPDGAIAEKYRVMQGDLLFARTGASVGKSYLYTQNDGDLYFAGFLIRFHIFDQNARFVFFQTQTPSYWSWVKSVSMRSGQPGISAEEYKKLPIVIAPLPEQKAIADILQTWDAAIETTEALIAAKERQFKWLAKKLMLTNVELKSEMLGDIAEASSGGTPTSTVQEYYGGDIPWVSIADMTEEGMWINSTHRTLSQKGFNHSGAKLYPRNTVLYAMYASIGECSIANVELTSSQAILGIVPNPKKLRSEYLYYYLDSLKKKIKLQGQWGTQSNLNAGIVKKFRIPLPSLKEQQRITKTLNTAHHEIDLLKQLADQYRTQKRGLMQKLLTGEWRVNGKQRATT